MRTLVPPLRWSLACAYGVLILACFAGALRLQGTYPTADNALFEYCGRAIVRGAALYRDVWDDKLPGVYFVNALWQLLFGSRYILHAAAETLVALLSAALLWLVMRDFEIGMRAPAAALLFAFLCLAFPLNSIEAYALPLLLAATLCARISWILTGLFVGAAAGFWIPSLLMLVPLFALFPQRTAATMLATAALAVAIPLGSVFWVAGPANFTALVHTWILYASSSTGTRVHHHLLVLNRFARTAQALENFRDGVIASGVAAFGMLFLAIVRKPATVAQNFALISICAMFLAAFVGSRFYSHYFISCFAAIVFGICAYLPGSRLHPARGVLLAVGIVLLARTIQVHLSGDDSSRATIAQRLAVRAGPIVAGKLTLHVDAYRPEFYLALDPVLHDPREILGSSQDPAARSSDPADADVVIDTGQRIRSGTRVCERTAFPIEMRVKREFSRAFASCP